MYTQTTPPDKPSGASLPQPPSAIPAKPSDASKQESGKTPEPASKPQEKQGNSALPGKDVPVLNSKDAQPPVEANQPAIPFQPPPGALIPIPEKEKPKKFEIGSIVWPSLLLIGMLALGALILAWLKKNKERQLAGISLSAHDQLSAFRDSMEQGDMTDDEFKKVKALLSEKIKRQQSIAPSAQAPLPPSTGKAEPDQPTK